MLSDIFVHLAPVEVGHAIIVDVEPAASLHAESEHTKRSSGALEVRLRRVQNASSHRAHIVAI